MKRSKDHVKKAWFQKAKAGMRGSYENDINYKYDIAME